MLQLKQIQLSICRRWESSSKKMYNSVMMSTDELPPFHNILELTEIIWLWQTWSQLTLLLTKCHHPTNADSIKWKKSLKSNIKIINRQMLRIINFESKFRCEPNMIFKKIRQLIMNLMNKIYTNVVMSSYS